MKEKEKQVREENPVSNLREEFGTEFTGDMNATKIYDVLAASKKGKRKK
ncbi:hypothetical protein [Bacillus sp. V5-8f]|nr:hypothetical protein [Bacillus sp. V5-8f]